MGMIQQKRCRGTRSRPIDKFNMRTQRNKPHAWHRSLFVNALVGGQEQSPIESRYYSGFFVLKN